MALLAMSAWICTMREDEWYFLASCSHYTIASQ